MKNKSTFISRMLTIAWAFLFSTIAVFAQSTVKGIVKDDLGEGIIGANVVVKGTTIGSITDFDGNFTIEGVPQNAVLAISFIGYISQEVTYTGQKEIEVILREDRQSLDEVMVVGYAVGSKRTVSGAVDLVKKEDMNKGVITDPADALKGKVAGVVISQSGGDPMGSTNIRIRGTSSLSGGNDPLVIIDGVFGDLNMLNALSPNDIESMTILKDASETAQYGSRGAAGVIVVSTTKGKAGFTKFDYSGQFGVNTVYRNIEMMSAADYRANVSRLGLTATDLGGNTNWLEEVENSTSITQNHNISFAGGAENHNYRASLGMTEKNGALRNSVMRNYTSKLDVTQLMFDKKLKLEMGLMASLREGQRVYDMQKMFYSAAAYNPTYPNTKNTTTGKWDEDLNANEVYNPLGQLEIENKYDVQHLNWHGKATWTILEGLNLSAFGSYTVVDITAKRYIPNDIRQGELNGNGVAYLMNSKRKNLMGNVQLSYSKDLGIHHIDALALVEGQNYKTFTFAEQAAGFETNYFGYYNLQAGANVAWGNNTSNYSEYSLMSYMGRVNYMLLDKYIATLNVRTDGSSKLGSGQKWGWFPSASLAWVVNKENFLADVRSIDQLKLRAGYGVTGNQDAISPYNSLKLMQPSGVTVVNGVNTTAFAITSNSNPDLKWEIKKTFDVGVDLSMWKGRLKVTADYYHSVTSDLLYTYTVPTPPFAYSTLLANLGEMTNSGIEFSVGGDLIRTKDWTFNASLNVAYAKNTLNSLSGTYQGNELTTSEHIMVSRINAAGLTQNYGVAYLIEGEPIGTFYLPHCTGISEEGLYQLADLNGDGQYDGGDDGDRQVCGQAIPKLNAGLSMMLKYKNWDLTAQFNGAFGHKIYNGTSQTYSSLTNFPTYNVLANAFEQNNGKGIYDNQVSDYWLEDGDYVNFEYATLGYNITKEQLNCKYISNIHLGLSCNNIATFTGYSGLTPMINSASLVQQAEGTTSYGTIGVDDKRIYPLTRTWSLSLSINF